MKALNLILFIICFQQISNAQNTTGLTIEYNLFTDQITYKKGNEIINKPEINQDENITVIIKEFNPYITKSTIEVHQINYLQSSTTLNAGDSVAQPTKGFGGMGSILGGLSLGNGASGIYDNIPGSRGASSKDIMQAKSKYRQMLKSLTLVEKKLNKSAEKINLFKTQKSSQNLASSDISK